MCNAHYLKAYDQKHKKVRGGIKDAKQFRRDFLVQEVSQLCELTLDESRLIVNTILKTIVDTLKRGESVSVPGFGKFLIHHRNRLCYGPNVFFVPSKQLVYLVKHQDYRKP